jgi:hypothetical protein
MNGVDRVMEELCPGYAERKSRKPKAAEEAAPEEKPQEGQAPADGPKPRKRRARTVKRESEGLAASQMFNMTIVGSIGLAGFPLQPGEKLVIAKLTPINVVKDAL